MADFGSIREGVTVNIQRSDGILSTLFKIKLLEFLILPRTHPSCGGYPAAPEL